MCIASPEGWRWCHSAPVVASDTHEVHPSAQLRHGGCTWRCGIAPNAGLRRQSAPVGAAAPDRSGSLTHRLVPRVESTDISGRTTREPGRSALCRVTGADLSVETARATASRVGEAEISAEQGPCPGRVIVDRARKDGRSADPTARATTGGRTPPRQPRLRVWRRRIAEGPIGTWRASIFAAPPRVAPSHTSNQGR